MEKKIDHKSGFVSIIGKPNVGKSTLMNALLGSDISIVTPKAQTTRHRILGIVNGPDFQVVFSDTPGIIKPSYEMQNSMMNFVKESVKDADIIVYMVTAQDENLNDQKLLNRIKKTKSPLFVLINKIDKSTQKLVEKKVDYWRGLFPLAKVYPISALNGFFISEVFYSIMELVPNSPAYFPKDQITDKPERFFVNESIRKQILQRYKNEIPYSVEVITEKFKESPKIININSVILVERESQKGIIIGHMGNAIKQVGINARKSLQNFFGKKIYLELRVKVSKNWRSDNQQLKMFGY